jgi:hypothetical protein
MDHKKNYIRRAFLSLVGICCFCILVSALSGCTTLRRKFTRKKKKDGDVSQKFIPVLEPIDYAVKVQSPLERYKYHYSLWRVWERDLLQAIEAEASDKRQKYLLAESIEQLEGMKNLLDDQERPGLTLLIDGLREVQKGYEKSASMRSKFSTKKKIERNSREVRNGFSPDQVQVIQEQ